MRLTVYTRISPHIERPRPRVSNDQRRQECSRLITGARTSKRGRESLQVAKLLAAHRSKTIGEVDRTCFVIYTIPSLSSGFPCDMKAGCSHPIPTDVGRRSCRLMRRPSFSARSRRGKTTNANRRRSEVSIPPGTREIVGEGGFIDPGILDAPVCRLSRHATFLTSTNFIIRLT